MAELARQDVATVRCELYDDGNFEKLARLLLRVWGSREVISRADWMAAGNSHGVRLVGEIDRLITRQEGV